MLNFELYYNHVAFSLICYTDLYVHPSNASLASEVICNPRYQHQTPLTCYTTSSSLTMPSLLLPMYRSHFALGHAISIYGFISKPRITFGSRSVLDPPGSIPSIHTTDPVYIMKP